MTDDDVDTILDSAMPCRKAPRIGHVTLIQNSAQEDTERGVFVGHRLRRGIAAQSGLLSGLSDADGLASLPDNLTPEDVRLWQLAKLVPTSPSTDELVTILTVADALGDTGQTAWTDALVQRIIHTEWQDSATSDAMLASLLTLPPHLLHRCLVACVPLWSSLPKLLLLLPQALHQPTVDASVADGSLHLSAPLDLSILALLSTATVPSPGLQRLQALQPTSGQTYCMSSVMAAALVRSLSAHPSLQKLDLGDIYLPMRAAARFAACLCRNGPWRLVDLSISTEHPNGTTPLITCLKHLPALTRLELNIQPRQKSGDSTLGALIRSDVSPARLPSLRQLEVDENQHTSNMPRPRTCLPTLLPLIDAPGLRSLKLTTQAHLVVYEHLGESISHLTALQELRIDSEAHADAAGSDTRRTADFVLPSLTGVAITSMSPEAPLTAAAFAAQAAPMITRLTVASEGVDADYAARCSRDSVVQAWECLLPALARCSRLLHLELGTLSGVHTGEHVLSHSADLAATLTALTGLTCLQLSAVEELVVDGSHCRMHGQPLGTALAALTALEVFSVCDRTGEMELLEPQHVLEACTGLSRLSRLGLCMHTEHGVHLPELIPKLRALRRLDIGGSMCVAPGVDGLQARFPELAVSVCCCSSEDSASDA